MAHINITTSPHHYDVDMYESSARSEISSTSHSNCNWRVYSSMALSVPMPIDSLPKSQAATSCDGIDVNQGTNRPPDPELLRFAAKRGTE